MRTKALLGAAILAAGLASSMAQNVYSLNVVGYVNKTVPANSWALIANPLTATNNDVSVLFANAGGGQPFKGLTVYKRNALGTGYEDAYWDDDLGSWNRAMDIPPGVGIWIKTPVGADYVNTFVGEVVMNSTNSVPAGYSMLGSAVPQSAALVSVMGFPFNKGADTFYFAKSGGGYDDYYWDGDLDDWNRNAPLGPVPDVGQGFWFYNAHSATNWVRNFTIPN